MNLNSFINNIKKIYSKYLASLESEGVQKLTAYFYIILTLATVSFFGLAAIGPTLSTVSNLNKQYKDNMTVYKELSQKLANLALLDSQYQTIQTNLDQLYAAIPKTAEIPKLTRQIENIASANNLQVTKFSVGTVEVFPNVKNKPIYSFLFTIDVAGSKTNVNNFIADVINFDRIVGVERITTGTNPESHYTTSFTGRVYFAPN